jgi:hypothetical protein
MQAPIYGPYLRSWKSKARRWLWFSDLGGAVHHLETLNKFRGGSCQSLARRGMDQQPDAPDRPNLEIIRSDECHDSFNRPNSFFKRAAKLKQILICQFHQDHISVTRIAVHPDSSSEKKRICARRLGSGLDEE